MKENYKINNIYNDNGVTFNELINNFLTSFLDKEFMGIEINGIINTDIISNL